MFKNYIYSPNCFHNTASRLQTLLGFEINNDIDSITNMDFVLGINILKSGKFLNDKFLNYGLILTGREIYKNKSKERETILKVLKNAKVIICDSSNLASEVNTLLNYKKTIFTVKQSICNFKFIDIDISDTIFEKSKVLIWIGKNKPSYCKDFLDSIKIPDEYFLLKVIINEEKNEYNKDDFMGDKNEIELSSMLAYNLLPSSFLYVDTSEIKSTNKNIINALAFRKPIIARYNLETNNLMRFNAAALMRNAEDLLTCLWEIEKEYQTYSNNAYLYYSTNHNYYNEKMSYLKIFKSLQGF